MPYVTSFEILSRQEGQQELVLKLLRRRLGNIDDAAQQSIKKLSSEQLEALADSLLEFMHLSDLHAWLQLSP